MIHDIIPACSRNRQLLVCQNFINKHLCLILILNRSTTNETMTISFCLTKIFKKQIVTIIIPSSFKIRIIGVRNMFCTIHKYMIIYP